MFVFSSLSTIINRWANLFGLDIYLFCAVCLLLIFAIVGAIKKLMGLTIFGCAGILMVIFLRQII